MLDVQGTEVAEVFDINFERGEFICCVHKFEDTDGNLLCLPEEQRLMEQLPDTADSLLSSSDTPSIGNIPWMS